MGFKTAMGRFFIILSVVVFTLGISLPRGIPSFVSTALAAEGKEEDPKAPHPEFEYVQIDPIMLPIITSRGITQQIRLMVQIEVEYGKKSDVEPYMPRLVDAYLQDLYGALSAGHGIMKNNFVDVIQVKQRLTSVTDKVLGEDHKAHGVLLQILQQQPM